MREFRDCTWSEGAEALSVMLNRLTIMRGILYVEPMRCLLHCANSLIVGDVRSAADACFDMTRAMLTGDYRRVSGNLFRDYMLHSLLVSEHPFAAMAANNQLDEAVYNAMRVDLGILNELMGLESAYLYRYVTDRYKELRLRNRQNKDSASQLASAAWGGGSVRPIPKEQQTYSIPAFMPEAAPVWSYGEEELRDVYAADEALEEMYHRLLSGGGDWASMTEDLWNFFAAYGTGIFLKSRAFVWRDGAIQMMDETRTSLVLPLMQREYRACLDHCIEFMRGNGEEPLLISGDAGMGKTTMLIQLSDELPEMRFVYVPGGNAGDLHALFRLLARQPLKFMVAIDDADPLLLERLAVRLIPVNVLLVATCAQASGGQHTAGGVFSKRVPLIAPRLDEFADMTQRLLLAMGCDLSRERVRSACVDHQVDTKGELTVAAAFAVAEKLRIDNS